jgi:hypothetical protein
MAMTTGGPEAALEAELQHMYDVVMQNLQTSKASTLNHVKLALTCDRVRRTRAPLMMLTRVRVLVGLAGAVTRDQAIAPSMRDAACAC